MVLYELYFIVATVFILRPKRFYITYISEELFSVKQFMSMDICLALHTGRFMLSLSQMTSSDNNGTSMLISERIQSSDSCLSFWYNVNCRSEQITQFLFLIV